MRRVVVLAVMLGALGCAQTKNVSWESAPQPRKSPAALPQVASMLPSSRASRGSSVLAFTLSALPFGAMLAVAIGLALRHRRRAQAESALDPRAPLVDGPAVVFGTVEGDQPGQSFVTIRIHQYGSEWQNKGAWQHRWAETGRDVTARPFRITRADGSRVLVEPDESVVIHDTLLVTEQKDLLTRDRVAEIRVGDEVHVYGELRGALAVRDRGAYREARTEPVLRPPPRSPMVIAHEPAGEAEAKRARFHAWGAAGLTLVLGGLGLVSSGWLRLVATGREATLAVTSTGTWQTWSKPKNRPGYWVAHYAVRGQATLPGEYAAVTLEDECSAELHACIRAGQCASVPFVVAGPYAEVGEPGLSTDQIAGLVMITLLAGFIYPIWAWTTRPWYVRKKLAEGGSGRLLGSS
jgi:hypothetical protein